ncbi:MAG: glutamate--tRNA ligase [Longimicrobiales bacterium]
MIRTRFAPSPTGLLHVGNARVSVLNWLITRHAGGAVVLRIEDTDNERNVDSSENAIFADLDWLGITPDEGPVQGGDAGPYRQSERLDSYATAAVQLLAHDFAYPCFCSKDELEAERAAILAAGGQPHYSGRCRGLTDDERTAFTAQGRTPAIRFAVSPDRVIVVDDAVYGSVRVNSSELGDFIIVRGDGLPTYNFAVVCDDMAMRITHVVRGVGHLSNTHRQVLIFEALGGVLPVFAHIPTVLGEDRQKLSKRNGAQSIAEYRENGYHPDALVNYLSLLSWSSPTGEEFLSREQLIAEISLDRIGAADVMFDPAKLRWLSGKHIEAMDLAALTPAVRPFLNARYTLLPDETLDVAVAAVRSHLVTFADINDALAPIFVEPAAPTSLTQGQRTVCSVAAELLETAQWTDAGLAAAIKDIGARAGAKGRALYEPLRLAVTGELHGPPFVPLLLVRGRDDVLRRIHATLESDGH